MHMSVETPMMQKDIQQAEDLLTEETFLSWYYKSDAAEMVRFEEWMSAYPQRSGLVSQAVALLGSVRLKEPAIDPADIQLAEDRMIGAIQKSRYPSFSLGSFKRTGWIAAASVLLLFTVGLAFKNYLLRSTVKTPYGEIHDQFLPDGSEVTLNANSKLTYYQWKAGQDREVWVKGEAYFQVKKTPEKSRFIVHTSRFDVIVTGTKFNVVDRSDRANVLLKEGSVIIHPNGSSSAAQSAKEIYMHPGDFVEYDSRQYKKQVKNDNKIIAWKDRKLVFENTSIREMAATIEEHYGVKVTIGDSSLLLKTISGMLPNDNLDVLLQSLEATGEYTIDRKDGNIILKGHP